MVEKTGIQKCYIDIFHQICKGRKLYLFGAGRLCNLFLREASINEKIWGIFDNDVSKTGKFVDGYKVMQLSDWSGKNFENLVVIITSKYYDEIKKQLEHAGVKYVFNFAGFKLDKGTIFSLEQKVPDKEVKMESVGGEINYFCTYFDAAYAVRGLAMYHSLLKSGEKFKLFIFAFDTQTIDILCKLNLRSVEVIPLNKIETTELLKVKKERTKPEYCWTCTAVTILYILNNYDVNEVTYLDADLYFFNRPDILLNEFHDSQCDVMITEHRYAAEYDQTKVSGKYCVQFMTFKNNENARNILEWWENRCLEWCFARAEDDKFGDQKYLDDWMIRFSNVHELKNIGGGVAPWNVKKYKCTEGPEVDGVPVVFYHFHQFNWIAENVFDIGAYDIERTVQKFIYGPYFEALKKSLYEIQENYDASFSLGMQRHIVVSIGEERV